MPRSRTALELRPGRALAGPVTELALSADGGLLATSDADRVVRLWSTATGAPVAKGKVNAEHIAALAFGPESDVLAAALSAPDLVRRINARTGRRAGSFTYHQGGARAVAFDPAGAFLVSGGLDGSAQVFDLATERSRDLAHDGRSVDDVAVAAGRVATACNGPLARIWNAHTGELLARPKHGGRVTAVALSPEGDLLATAATMPAGPSAPARGVRVWDAATGRPLGGARGPERNVAALRFLPGGLLAALNEPVPQEIRLEVWDARGGRLLAAAPAAADRLAASADGRTLATCHSGRPGLQLWSLTRG